MVGVGVKGIHRYLGAAPSGPTAPAGATFAVAAHPSCCASDADHLVPCGDGDAIRWWKELVTGVWYEVATSGLRPIMQYDEVRGWYSQGDGVSRYFPFPLGYTVTLPFSCGACARVYSGGNYQAAFSGATQTFTIGQNDEQNGGLYANRWTARAIAAFTYGQDWTTVGTAATGVQGRCWIGGVEVTAANPPDDGWAFDSVVWLHAANAVQYCSNSRVYRAAMYGSVLDADGRATFTTWLGANNT